MTIQKAHTQARPDSIKHIKPMSKHELMGKLAKVAYGKQDLRGLTPCERARAIDEQRIAKKRLYELQSVHLGNKVGHPGSYWNPNSKALACSRIK